MIHHLGKIFLFSTNQQIFQISLHLYKNWLTYEMDDADFKYEVENSVKCHVVASFLQRQRCRRYVMTYSPYLLIDT